MDDKSSFVCPVCGNADNRSIGMLNGKYYCRRCISFRGERVERKESSPKKSTIYLSYDLSTEQKELSNKLVENYVNGIDSLICAVTGAGKTEIVLAVIALAISKGQKVGFAVPRRDVAKELYVRFKSILKNNRVEAIYGGHTNRLEADLICLTTHQLFRYSDYFDLLILDEVDAFPFNGDDVLQAFFAKSIRGHYVMMSATPPENVIQEFKKPGKMILELDKRFHGHPLPVPVIKIAHGIMKYYQLNQVLRRFSLQNKPVFIFTPTIEMCEKVYSVLRFLFSNVYYVHSKCSDRSETIEKFRKGQIKLLVTTAVLERGVTLKDLQVVVFGAEHALYTSAALIQIAGRAGRKKECPTGEVIFIANKKTEEMELAIKEIERANKHL